MPGAVTAAADGVALEPAAARGVALEPARTSGRSLPAPWLR